MAVTDSAGVRIVTHAAGALAAAEQWSLSAEPVVEIGGGVDPVVPLYRVTAVQPLAGGGIVVGTTTPARALLFGGDGTLIATLGREGDGPGEFQDIASIVPLGDDSVGVWDDDRRRLAVFTAAGEHERDIDLADVAPLSPEAAPSTSVPAARTSVLRLASGSLALFVAGVWGFEDSEPGVVRVPMASRRIDPDGVTRASYPAQPGMEMYTTGPLPYPFGASTHGVASGDALVIGTAEAPEVRFFGADAALEQIVRWEDADRTVAGSARVAEYEAWLDAQIAQRQPEARTFFRELFDAIPLPDRFPAYGAMIADTESGDVWVGEYPGQLGLMGMSPESRPMPARTWIVFRADGELIATVRTPERFEPFAVRGDRVVGVFRDDVDVESVRAYAITRE